MNISKQNLKFYIIIGALVIIAVVVTVVKNYYEKKPNTEILSQPSTINLAINNQEYQTPLRIKLEPDTYIIWGFAEGYQISETEYQIKADKFNNIFIKLEKETEVLPPEGAPID